MSLTRVKAELKKLANKEKAQFLQRYFKTGKGEYAEGDIFLGITVPEQRKVAKKFWKEVSLKDAAALLQSSTHEHRFTALEILGIQFEKGTEKTQKDIYKLCLENRKYINNWDLVDTASPYIFGEYLQKRPREILYKLARSKSVWDRRIAIISTFNFIRTEDYKDTFAIAEMLLEDTHDLIHKAVGWMLREVGNRSQNAELGFLDRFAHIMPRTMLRYAVEKFPQPLRKHYYAKK